MEGGGEGLYARRTIPSGTVVAFYNGIRCYISSLNSSCWPPPSGWAPTTSPLGMMVGSHIYSMAFHWSPFSGDYAIVVEWEDKVLAFPFPWSTDQDHMDLPPEVNHPLTSMFGINSGKVVGGRTMILWGMFYLPPPQAFPMFNIFHKTHSQVEVW